MTELEKQIKYYCELSESRYHEIQFLHSEIERLRIQNVKLFDELQNANKALAGTENIIAAMNKAEEELRNDIGTLMVETAERQREACAAAVDRLVDMVRAGAGEATLGQRVEQAVRVVRATPLVTENK